MSLLGILGTGFGPTGGGGPADYPAIGDVRFGVLYGFNAFNGTLVEPDPADVRLGIRYGADGVEFTGTLEAPDQVLPLDLGSADVLMELIRHKLDPESGGLLPISWKALCVKDTVETAAWFYPMAAVTKSRERLLEYETDNRVLVGYTFHIGLMVKEKATLRTDRDLETIRRQAQQAVYTTAYPGVAVETIEMDDAEGVPWPGLEKGVTGTGFTLTVGVCEDRGPRVQGDPPL